MAQRRKPEPLYTVGWREYIDLPDWDITGLEVKCDTGARTSAIDVDDVVHLADDRARFTVVFDRAHPERRRTIEADIERMTRVRSSNGAIRERMFVKTLARIGLIEKTIEISLVSRHRMICRMLLGRTALSPEFVVDSSRVYCLAKLGATK